MKNNMQIIKEEFSRILELHKNAGYKTIVTEQNTSSNVTNIQSFLKTVDGGKYKSLLGTSGPNKDGVDGQYGPKTTKAVIEFQKDNGLKGQEGIVGQETSKAMNSKGGNNIQSTISNKSSLENKIDNKPQTIKFKGCPKITSSSNIEGVKEYIDLIKSKSGGIVPTDAYFKLNFNVSTIAGNLATKGIPDRVACEIALVRLRPKYRDKYEIIVDSINKLLYLLDKKGEFIYKTYIITGYNKQSDDAKTIARALETWDESATRLGFKYVEGKGYVDVTGKNRNYDPEIIYADTDANKVRFLPKGIYATSKELKSDSDYAGGSNNVLSLFKDGNELAQAIHGYYLEKPRTEALALAKQVLSSNGTDPKVNQQFLDAVSKNKINLSQSYGCINIPYEALNYLKKYMTNAYVFNIGEGDNNYLVMNGENYFDKTLNSTACPSPQSLGAEPVQTGIV